MKKNNIKSTNPFITELKAIMLFLSALCCSTSLTAGPLKTFLHEGWQFKQARLTNWYPADVPGVVHTDLMANGIIEDPFFRLNERGVQWVDKEDWIYQKQFDLSSDLLDKDHIELVFDGLDTYADVYLNDSLLFKANNMFRTWRADIKPFVKATANNLKVYFHSPIKVDMPKFDALPFHYEASNDQSENGGIFDKRLSVFARKAGYHYGWDWGPRLVTSGIWRPVYMECWDTAKLDDVYFHQTDANTANATGEVIVEIHSDKAIANAFIEVADKESQNRWCARRTDLKPGFNKITLPYRLRKPKLWWSNGLGEPHRYTLVTTLSADDTVLDNQEIKIGLRKLQVVNKPDAKGKTFYMELNGQPIFAKGANYIPQDNFLPRVTPDKYKETILSAVQANMNMLRVWGGGIYENDLFYDLCDEYGILVWQDFMFACSLYPAEGELLENIRLEAIENVRRLRNHPCIALWCGNNECNDAWHGWGWKRNYGRQDLAIEQLIRNQYLQQYHITLPQVVEEHAPGTFYWPSSPFSATEIHSDGLSGDYHYWEVWHGEKPIAEYNRVKARFFSEYGFQSFPEFESVKRYAPLENDWQMESEVMMAHQRGGAGANRRIANYLLNEYRQPATFKEFLYINQIMQADAIKTAIEAHRRDMPYCMGSLYWQHNDCWPVASWSSRDYYGRWKALHYRAKDAFEDILISPIADEEGRLKIYIVSDRLKRTSGKMEITIAKFDGTCIYSHLQQVQIAANTSKVVFSKPIDQLLHGASRNEVVVLTKLTDRQGQTYRNDYFLVQQKEIHYPQTTVKKCLKKTSKGYEITLKSDNFARGVFVTTGDTGSTFSDNYFDLWPGEPKTITIQTGLTQDELEKNLVLTTY